MSPADVQAYIERLASRGLTIVEDGKPVDVVVFINHRVLPCSENGENLLELIMAGRGSSLLVTTLERERQKGRAFSSIARRGGNANLL